MHNMTAVQLLDMLRSGSVSCEELTEMYISRIEMLNGRLNAVRLIDPTAKEQARRLDASGDRQLPLFGLPILVKDNIDVAGLPTTAGSAALEGNIAAKDAPVIANLRRRGAVILGKTNMTEFANYTTQGMPNGFSSLGGQVVNAYSPAMDPSGSSTGSAVAVSAGMCAAAIGTDTLFSVVGCATCNGVAGFKPSHGALSVEGIIPICHTLDSAGPLARSFEDALLIYMGMRDETPEPVSQAEIKGLRIAVNMTGWERVSGEQQGRYLRLFDALRAAGAEVTEVFHTAPACQRAIMRCEFSHDMDEYLAASGAEIKTLRGIAGFFEDNPRHMPYGITLIRDALENASGQMDDAEYIEAMGIREDLRAEMAEAMKDFDACIMTGSSCIFHVCGMPSAALPLCMAEDGTPRGIILYGTDEKRLISAALTIEKHCPGVLPPA